MNRKDLENHYIHTHNNFICTCICWITDKSNIHKPSREVATPAISIHADNWRFWTHIEPIHNKRQLHCMQNIHDYKNYEGQVGNNFKETTYIAGFTWDQIDQSPVLRVKIRGCKIGYTTVAPIPIIALIPRPIPMTDAGTPSHFSAAVIKVPKLEQWNQHQLTWNN